MIKASKNKHLVITNFLIESMVQAIRKGLKQQNHMEMIDFFKFATFLADQDNYWPPLVHKFVI